MVTKLITRTRLIARLQQRILQCHMQVERVGVELQPNPKRLDRLVVKVMRPVCRGVHQDFPRVSVEIEVLRRAKVFRNLQPIVHINRSNGLRCLFHERMLADLRVGQRLEFFETIVVRA